jgi:hypothetical protein
VCQLQVPYNKLACPRHWAMLPPKLQSRIYRAWRAHDRTAHRAAVKEALDLYESAS